MFVSFFPNPRPFFISVVIWTLICTGAWYAGASDLGAWFGLTPPAPDAPPVIGPGFFVTPDFLWFYVYWLVATLIYYAFWKIRGPHPWMDWSILGSSLILFVVYFQVQVSVGINHWRGPFFDMLQNFLASKRPMGTPEYGTALEQFYTGLLQFAGLAFVFIAVVVLNSFFVSHWIFRWRTAMNDYYMANWERLRKIEGASQRVQEDTMRFSSTMEGLGVSLVDSIMTLIAFMPILLALSSHIVSLPLVGEIPHPLAFAAVAWALFGTLLLAVVGIRLPGLEFQNQRVEAAYRKELVYGEDHESRAQPPTVRELFGNVRKNYFRMYFHYMYFNVARYFYIQADNIFGYMILAPTIAAGAITFGVMQQILTAFGQVTNSFQYLVNSWPTIVELISIYKRLRAFEAKIHDEPLPSIDQRYMAGVETDA